MSKFIDRLSLGYIGRKCDHIIAFHCGHLPVSLSEAKKEPKLMTNLVVADRYCEIIILKYCPMCGLNLKKIMNFLEPVTFNKKEK